MDGQGSGCTDGEGAGRRPGQDPPLPSARPSRIGALVHLHARGHGGGDVRVDRCPAISLPRSAGVRALPSTPPFLGVRVVPAARPGPRGQDAGRGGDRLPARGASRGDRGGGLPVPLRGDGPPGVPGAFRRSVGRLRTFGGRRILLDRPLLAGRPAVSGNPMEHRGGAPERGGALQDPFGAVLVPASQSGTWTRGRTFSHSGSGRRTHARPACPRTRGWITGFFGTGGDGFPGSRGRTPGPPRGSGSRRGG